MTFTYATPRKIGVGFNAPRVLGGAMQFDWRRSWGFSKRLARHDAKRPRWHALPASAVEAHRQFATELKPRKRKA